MVESIIGGVTVGVIMLIINTVAKRNKVKTRQDVTEEELKECKVAIEELKELKELPRDVKELKEAIGELKEENKTVMKVLLPLVLAVSGHKPNGEVKAALKLLDNYLIEK